MHCGGAPGCAVTRRGSIDESTDGAGSRGLCRADSVCTVGERAVADSGSLEDTGVRRSHFPGIRIGKSRALRITRRMSIERTLRFGPCSVNERIRGSIFESTRALAHGYPVG